MRLIEEHVKFRILTPEEAKTQYDNPPEGLHVIRGGVILEGEVWLTRIQAADKKEIEKAQQQVRQQIVKTVKQAMK